MRFSTSWRPRVGLIKARGSVPRNRLEEESDLNRLLIRALRRLITLTMSLWVNRFIAFALSEMYHAHRLMCRAGAAARHQSSMELRSKLSGPGLIFIVRYPDCRLLYKSSAKVNIALQLPLFAAEPQIAPAQALQLDKV
jgi:hypothetical protein